MDKKFAVNDYVIYGKSGLCVISEIKTVRITNIKNEYYVLNAINGNQCTIYVPCHNQELVGKMRLPMTKAEIDDLLLSARGEEIKWIDNSNERNECFKQITDSEDYKNWILLISCLYCKKMEKLSGGKHLSLHDENTLKLLEKLVQDEFCYSLNLDKCQIAEYIQNILNK